MTCARPALLFFLSLLPLVLAFAEEAEPVEGAPVLFAKDLVPLEFCENPLYGLSPIVEVRDFGYVFRLDSKFGRFNAYGLEELRERLREIEALAQLEDISQAQAFAATLSKSATDPVFMTFGIARRPLSTVVGLPSGISRYFQGKLHQARRISSKTLSNSKKRDEATGESPVEEEKLAQADEDEGSVARTSRSVRKLGRRHLGYESSKRKWARRFGVDPYSENMRLQEELGRIAWASSLGGFTADFVVPGSEVLSYAGRAQELVWERPPYQLERDNERALREIGLEKPLRRSLIESDLYSLTEKTAFRIALESLREAEGLETLIAFILDIDSDLDASIAKRTVALLERYNREISTLDRIELRRGMIVASAQNGYDVLPVAADYLHWTPVVASALLAPDFEAELREVWISGEVSSIAKLRLKRHGWEVFDMRCTPE